MKYFVLVLLFVVIGIILLELNKEIQRGLEKRFYNIRLSENDLELHYYDSKYRTLFVPNKDYENLSESALYFKYRPYFLKFEIDNIKPLK